MTQMERAIAVIGKDAVDAFEDLVKTYGFKDAELGIGNEDDQLAFRTSSKIRVCTRYESKPVLGVDANFCRSSDIKVRAWFNDDTYIENPMYCLISSVLYHNGDIGKYVYYKYGLIGKYVDCKYRIVFSHEGFEFMLLTDRVLTHTFRVKPETKELFEIQ